MSDVVSLDWTEFLESWGLALLALAGLLALCVVSLPFVLIGLRRRIDRLIEQNATLIRHLQEARPSLPPAASRPAATRPQPTPRFKPATAKTPRHPPPPPPPILRADVTLRQNQPGQD